MRRWRRPAPGRAPRSSRSGLGRCGIASGEGQDGAGEPAVCNPCGGVSVAIGQTRPGRQDEMPPTHCRDDPSSVPKASSIRRRRPWKNFARAGRAWRRNRRLRVASVTLCAGSLNSRPRRLGAWPRPRPASRLRRPRYRQAELAVQAARLRLERMTLRAPISGRVLALNAQPGRRVTGLAPASEQDSATVLTLYDPQPAPGPGRCASGRCAPGSARSAGSDRVARSSPQPLTGQVLTATSIADIQKNTLQVKVAIDAPPPVIKPDMLVQVTFLAPETSPEEVGRIGRTVAVARAAAACRDGRWRSPRLGRRPSQWRRSPSGHHARQGRHRAIGRSRRGPKLDGQAHRGRPGRAQARRADHRHGRRRHAWVSPIRVPGPPQDLRRHRHPRQTSPRNTTPRRTETWRWSKSAS